MTGPLQIEAHYRKQWPGEPRRAKWNRGPIHELPSDFEILTMALSPTVDVYATVCMSQPDDADRLELHLLAARERETSDQLVELLTVVAHYHRTGARLGLGHTVNFGRPWVRGATASFGLISLPYLDGPTLEWSENHDVRFLWLIPITADEVAYKKKHGLDALEEAFERASFNYLDPRRRSVV